MSETSGKVSATDDIGLTKTQAEALGDLVAELNAASELFGKGLRQVDGRSPGFFTRLSKGDVPSHLKYPGEPSGGRRKKTRGRSLRGGAINCRDNWVINFVVDSAIILAGTGALVTGTYSGYKALQYFMSVYQLNDAIVQIIDVLYNFIKAGIQVGLSGSSTIIRGVTDVGRVGLTAASDIGMSAAAAAPSVAKSGVILVPPIAIGRYVGTGISAQADAERILDGLNRKYAEIIARTGVYTRSIEAKREALLEQIDRAKRASAAKYAEFAAGTTAATASYTTIKKFICDKIEEAGLAVESAGQFLIDPTGLDEGLKGLIIDEYPEPDAPAAAAAAAADGAPAGGRRRRKRSSKKNKRTKRRKTHRRHR